VSELKGSGAILCGILKPVQVDRCDHILTHNIKNSIFSYCNFNF